MSEEKLMVLKLLEDGKISQKEAEALLEALGDDSKTEHKTRAERQTEKQTDDFKRTQSQQFDNQEERFEDKFEDFTRHFGRRMTQLGSEIADKSISLAEKMVGAIENIVETGSFQWDSSSRYQSYEEMLEYPLPDNQEFSLNFSTINGRLSVEAWEENKIQVKALIRAQPHQYEEGHPILMMKENDQELTFLPRTYDSISMLLQIKVPNRIYGTIRTDNKNASVHIEQLACRNLYARTKNGSLSMLQLKVESELGCSSSNGKISLDQISSGNILAATKNSKIQLSQISTTGIDLLTANGKIYLNELNYLPLNRMKLETSNGGIYIEDPLPDRSIHLDAATTNGKINVSPQLTILNSTNQSYTTKVSGKKELEGSQEAPLIVNATTSNANITLFL